MKKSTLAALLLSIVGLQAQTPICPKTIGTELVTNGSFSNGNTGFISDYTYTAGNMAPAQFSIGPSPIAKNSYFANITDHTSGLGEMMIIDADNVVGKDLYRTTVAVMAGRTYFFSAWVANISTMTVCCNTNPPVFQNPPKIRFSIEGVAVSPVLRVDSTHHEWRQFYTTWRATSTGVIDIAIENLHNAANGNDLALDDISFKASCSNIVDLSSLGKKSALPDTVYTCNVKFPLQLDTKLSNAKYAFNWYKQNSTESIGIQPEDQKTIQSSSTFTINAYPPNRSKYYVCYDSLGDGLTCPRLDSILFLREFNFDLGASKTVCPPVSEVLAPSVVDVSSYNYEKLSNGISLLKSGTGVVEPLTITTAGTYRLSATHFDVVCGTYSDIIKIDTFPNPEIGAITRSCNNNNGAASLTVRLSGNNVNLIDGKVNISWFKTPDGGNALATSTTEASIAVSNSELVVMPNCSTGGLYLQDNNSFASKIPMADPCPNTGFNAVQPEALVYAISSSVNFDLSSFKILPRAFTPLGESISYQVNLYSNTVPLQNIRYAPALYSGPVTTAWVTNTAFSDSKSLTIKGIEGIPAGSYYLAIKAYQAGSPQNSRELGSKTCTGTVANLQDSRGLVKITNLYEHTIAKPNAIGSIFGIDIHIGIKRPCARQWVCSQCVVVTDQKDLTSHHEATIYPNPTDNQVTINLESNEPYTYTLSNMYGQELHTASQSFVGSTQMDVSSYASGTYLLTIKTSGKAKTHFLVIQ